MTTQEDPFVSVVVPVYDNRSGLCCCLASILQTTYPHFEVVVVDDASPVDQRVFEHPRLRYVRLPKNLGPAGARNAGVVASRGRIVLFTDADCIVPRDWVPRFAALLDDARADRPSIVAACGRLEHGRGFLDSCHAYTSYGYVQGGARRLMPFLNTSCAAIERRTFDAIGGFTPALRTHEDYDLALNIVERGGAILFEPQISVFHDHRISSPRELLSAQWTLGATGGRLFEERHPRRLGPLSPLLRARGLLGALGIFPIALATTIRIAVFNVWHHPDVLLYTPLILASKTAFRCGVYHARRRVQPRGEAHGVAPREWKQHNREYHEDAEIVASYDRRLLHKFEVEQERYTTEPWSQAILETSATPVLDAGCGTGVATLRLLRKGIPTVSLDISAMMLKTVRAKTLQARLSSACAQGDVEQLPFRDGSFGAIVCTGVLHHLVDAGAVLPELLRVLRPGGLLFIAEPCDERPWLSAPYATCIELLKPFLRPLRGLPSCWAERPLTGADVTRLAGALSAHGLSPEVRFLVYWPFINERIGARLAAALTALLNRINKGAPRGDVVNIVARKPRAVSVAAPDVEHLEGCRA